jgi:DNA-binding transcriptional MocR family regulator
LTQSSVNRFTVSMTIWTPELRKDRPAYQALADAIAADRASGSLPPGAQLPPHRALARALGVTVGTVTRGYGEAARRKLVRGEVGRGTYVLDPSPPELLDTRFARREAVVDDILNLTITRPASDRLTESLSRGLSDLSTADLSSLVSYGPAEGAAGHRAAVSDWLKASGVQIAPEQVIICNGAQNGLALACAGLLKPGDAVAVDDMTYPGFKAAANMFGLRLLAVASDGQGMTPEGLGVAAKAGASAVYLMPTLHNPTMQTIPLNRRQDLAIVAEAADLLIIEDDVYGFLEPDHPTHFATLAPERTALVGGVSKFMAPALRIGWIAPPTSRVAEVEPAIRGLSWMASPLAAHMVAGAMVTGEAESLAESQRNEACVRLKMVQAALGPWLPNSPLPDCAMHVWLSLPESWRADEFVAEALTRKLAISPAGAFAVGPGRAPHAIRFGLGAHSREALTKGLSIMADLLDAKPRAGMAVV